MTPTVLTVTLGALLAAPPSITEVQPAPLALGGVAEVVGDGYVAGQTAVTVGGAPQQVVNVQPTRTRFIVPETTPLGTQTLVVTTPDGNATTSVVVAPPAPVISTITPETVELGGRITVQGEHLDGITAVTVGDENASITEKTAFVLVVEIPYVAELLGTRAVVFESPSGPVQREITITPPTPSIDAVAPNPVRRGDLIEIRGRIVPVNVGVRVGLLDAPVVLTEPNRVLAQVPDEVEIGPHDVTVSVGQLTSAPEGPVYVQAAAADRPRVIGTYPVNVAAGGAVWIVGTDLDTVDSALHGLSVDSCDRRACRLGTVAAPVGVPLTAAVTGPSGAALFALQVIDEPVILPVIDSVEPDPAFRGEPLIIRGSGLQTVKTVIIGGRPQSITFFDAESVVIKVAGETPLGAERLFIASNGGSEPITVTVLDPFPTDDVSDGDADVGDVSGGDVDAGADTAEGTGGGGGDDCAAGGEPGGALVALALALGLLITRRRRYSGFE